MCEHGSGDKRKLNLKESSSIRAKNKIFLNSNALSTANTTKAKKTVSAVKNWKPEDTNNIKPIYVLVTGKKLRTKGTLSNTEHQNLEKLEKEASQTPLLNKNKLINKVSVSSQIKKVPVSKSVTNTLETPFKLASTSDLPQLQKRSIEKLITLYKFERKNTLNGHKNPVVAKNNQSYIPLWEENPFIKKVAKSTPKNSIVKEASSSSKSFTPSSLVRTNAKNSPGIMSSKSPTRKSIDNARAQSGAKSSGKQPGRGSIVNRDDLNTCRFCNRRFADDRLAVHEDICSKTAKKQRKTYDATKHRVQGTELEPYARKLNRSMTQKISNPTISKSLPKQQSQHQSQGSTGVKKTDWRRKHEEFIGAIRAAKMAQAHVAAGGKLSDLPPPPPSENPDYVQCPHCGRRFNQTAAERHIPKCATYEFNKQKPARPGGRK